jgi:hypothetical protein
VLNESIRFIVASDADVGAFVFETLGGFMDEATEELNEELDIEPNDQIESFLIDSDLPFEEVQEGFWLINDEADHIDNIVLYHSPPVVTFRVKLMEVPDTDDHSVRLALFQRLLELNATSMVAGAYGLEQNSVVVVDTLQSQNLDYNEFQASIDGIALAVREHYHELKDLLARARGETPAERSESSETKVTSLDEALADQGDDALNEELEAAAATTQKAAESSDSDDEAV